MLFYILLTGFNQSARNDAQNTATEPIRIGL
jgi:hypothetical protein